VIELNAAEWVTISDGRCLAIISAHTYPPGFRDLLVGKEVLIDGQSARIVSVSNEVVNGHFDVWATVT
jgi:hypothetical protein